jgi:hypothetical protein
MNSSPPEPSTRCAAVGRFLLRALFVLAAAFLALGAGSWFAARYIVAPGQGLTGPFEVLAYGALSALGAGVLAVAGSSLLRGRVLAVTSLIVAAGAAALLGHTVYDVYQTRAAQRDPDSAYAGVPAFTATLEQIVVTDPYLRVKVEVDSSERRWVNTGPAPEHQVCRGTIRAQMLQDVSAALATAIQGAQAEIAACESSRLAAQRRFAWAFEDGSSSGEWRLSPAVSIGGCNT